MAARLEDRPVTRESQERMPTPPLCAGGQGPPPRSTSLSRPRHPIQPQPWPGLSLLGRAVIHFQPLPSPPRAVLPAKLFYFFPSITLHTSPLSLKPPFQGLLHVNPSVSAPASLLTAPPSSATPSHRPSAISCSSHISKRALSFYPLPRLLCFLTIYVTRRVRLLS